MRTLTFSTGREVVSKVIGCCGSLALPYHNEYWRYLEVALRGDDMDLLRGAADGFVCEITPEEGEIHPCRAFPTILDREVWFTTPGGVVVRLTAPENGRLWVHVDFNRDSKQLASEMLAMLAIFCGYVEFPLEADGIAMSAGEALVSLLQPIHDLT